MTRDILQDLLRGEQKHFHSNGINQYLEILEQLQ